MKIENLENSCTGCFACMNACPVDAITLEENEEGFYFPVINKDKCITCGLCDKTCPQIEESRTFHMKKSYYAWSLDDNVRRASSSGGMFSIIADLLLKEEGVAYGAVFNYDGILRLECKSTDESELKFLQKSKYVQNYIGYAFRQIKSDLKNGRRVLFCGTPCQVDGLSRFLKSDYSNLILCDFICHGVPSMSLLRLHLENLGISDVKEIDFRPKRNAWVDNLKIIYGNNKKYERFWHFDEYFTMFEKCTSLRKSCYDCHYCNGDRCSDITLADFWGVYKYDASLYDKNGISLLLVNTDKGDSIIKEIIDSKTCCIKEIPSEFADYVYARKRKDPATKYDINLRNQIIKDIYSIGYRKTLKDRNLKSKKFDVYKYDLKRFIKRIIQRLRNKDD